MESQLRLDIDITMSRLWYLPFLWNTVCIACSYSRDDTDWTESPGLLPPVSLQCSSLCIVLPNYATWRRSKLHRDCACSERASKVVRYFYVLHRPVSGVATGWTGVDMSTPLLLEVTPEIDTNQTSFTERRGGVSPVGSASRPPL